MTDPSLLVAAKLLADRVGVTVPPYRRPLLTAELERLGHGDISLGLDTLRAGGQPLLEQLASTFAVGETYLFRGPNHFRALRRIARLRADQGLPLNVLCAGVATGEEAWSAAMVIADIYEETGLAYRVLGWDLSRERLRRARLGRFGSWSARSGFMGYDRYLVPTKDGHEVQPTLRHHVCFEHVNLTRSLPHPHRSFDAIFFRNVSMYWCAQRANTVATGLAERLSRHGSLFVGPTDPISMPAEAWSVELVGTSFIYRRVEREPEPPSLDVELRPLTATVAQAPEPRSSSVPAPRPRPTHAPQRAQAPIIEADNVELIDRVRSLADHGHHEQALSMLDAEATLSPDLLELQATICLSLGDAHRAVELFRAAAYWDDGNPAYARWLDMAMAARDRRQLPQSESKMSRDR